jgi:hypothetical protein
VESPWRPIGVAALDSAEPGDGEDWETGVVESDVAVEAGNTEFRPGVEHVVGYLQGLNLRVLRGHFRQQSGRNDQGPSSHDAASH